MNLATFDLNLLRTADALLTERSVTRAADRIGVTQQAMSAQLRRLRESFDDPLLIQSGRRLVPTALGAALMQPIREALVHIERALTTTPNFDTATSRRRFSIAARSYAAAMLIPQLMNDLATSAPKVSVLLARMDNGVFRNLAEGRVDIAVSSAQWRESRGLLPDEIRSTPLYDDTFVCVLDGCRLRGAADMSLDAYLTARHAVVDLGADGLTNVQRAWIKHRLSPTVAYVQENFIDLLLVLPGTDLVATVPRRLALRWAARLGLAVSPPPFPIDGIRMEMWWHVRDELDPACTFMRDTLGGVATQIR